MTIRRPKKSQQMRSTHKLVKHKRETSQIVKKPANKHARPVECREGDSQHMEKKPVSKRYSPSVEHSEKDKSGHQKKARRPGELTFY